MLYGLGAVQDFILLLAILLQIWLAFVRVFWRIVLPKERVLHPF